MTDIDWYMHGERNLSAADLMIQVLAKLNTTVFDRMVELSGKANALAALKPYAKMKASYLVSEAKKKFNLQSNGPDALLLTYLMASVCVAPPEKLTGELKERGAVGTTRDCIFKSASPEFCMQLSHYYSEYVAETINPDYECVWTHHETNGDPFCRYVFKKRSDPITVLDDPGKTLVTIPKFDMPMEQLQANSLWALSSFWDSASKAFADIQGVAMARAELLENARGIGRELGSWFAENQPEIVGDPSAIAKLVRGMYNSLGQKDRFTVRENDIFSDEVTDCTQQGWGCEMCKQYEAFFNGMVSAINPNWEFFYDRMITQDDKSCHWIIKKATAGDDSLILLKRRLVKGEITEEDYMRLKALLEE